MSPLIMDCRRCSDEVYIDLGFSRKITFSNNYDEMGLYINHRKNESIREASQKEY
jgi:hypothetical protein